MKRVIGQLSYFNIKPVDNGFVVELQIRTGEYTSEEKTIICPTMKDVTNLFATSMMDHETAFAKAEKEEGEDE